LDSFEIDGHDIFENEIDRVVSKLENKNITQPVATDLGQTPKQTIKAAENL
jgi:hypothetical protein